MNRVTDVWSPLESWWISEVEDDQAYQRDITPLILDLLDPQEETLYLDVGCGEGRVMGAVRSLGSRVIGVDSSAALLARASARGPVVRAVLPDLEWLRDGSVGGAWLSLVLEHIEDDLTVFEGLARAVRVGGPLVLVMNHPVYTAPGSAPIFDSTDGETLWRWGKYLTTGSSTEPAGSQVVTFYHRPIGALLNNAASAGWRLEEVRELGPPAVDFGHNPVLAGREHQPRVLGVRWVRT